MHHRPALRSLAVLLVTALTASCASSAADTTPASAPRSTSDPATSRPGTSDPATGDPVASDSATSDPDTTAPAPVEVPAPPTPSTFAGTPAEQAAQLLAATVDPTLDAAAQRAAVLGAFAAAGLPVIGPSGASLTTVDDPVGLPWIAVWAASTVTEADPTVSLHDVVGLLRLMNPAGALDVDAAAADLLAHLRELTGAVEPTGPGFVAHFVAADALRTAGIDLADPTVAADQVRLGATSRLLLIGGALRAVYEGYLESGAIAAPTAPAGFTGPAGFTAPLAHPRVDDLSGLDGCDDGANGWYIWLVSKFFAGAKPFPGLPLEWKGIYGALAQLGVDSGRLVPEVIEMTDGVGRFAGVAGALVNIGLFATQLSDRHAVVTMSGSGPLVRTKTTSHGEAREISVRISYDTGHEEQVKVRNCILAALSATGSNAQQALGNAAGVEVEVTGGAGFADRLITAGSLVLFGPGTYQPVQTADDGGVVTVPVQGRAQPHEIADDAPAVAKEFSVVVEASLDPVSASTIGRAFADDLLCLGNAASGNPVDTLSECQNAVIDILKQFHWDLGEFTFPLTDWQPKGWYVDEVLTEGDFPLAVAGSSCDSELGEWILSITGGSGGMQVWADLVVTFGEDRTGVATLDWSGGGGGVSFQSQATVAMELTPDGAGFLMHFVPGSYSTTVSGGAGSHVFGNGGEGGLLHVQPAPDGMCG